MLFSRAAVTNSLLTKLSMKKTKEPVSNKVPADKLLKRLDLLVH